MSSASSDSDPPAANIPPSTLAHFTSNPWTAPLLRLPTHTAIPTSSRTSDPTTGEDAFFAHTLNTPHTIPHLLTLRKSHPTTPANTLPTPFPPPALTTPRSNPPSASIDLLALLSLSNPGLSGHPNTAHGGVTATLLDEIMSLATSLHIPGYFDDARGSRDRLFTVQLDIRYRRKVVVPGTAVVKAWCVARDGRKYFMRGVVVQEEEQGGMGEVVCAEAYGVWVLVGGGKL
ncbi:hypothetical protein FQN50_003079 [Emmonsiellopsis sp. PD_5]|nr:hypothetical protein FQN50_003079 [Emmonsiellopsis sp. PD_5]